jgi:hypothetical protein
MHTPIFPIANSHMSVQLVGILSGDFTLFHSHSRNASFRPRWTRSLATLSIRMAGMADDRVNGLSRRSGELDIFTWATSFGPLRGRQVIVAQLLFSAFEY